MKKLPSLLLALCMVCAMALPVFAEEAEDENAPSYWDGFSVGSDMGLEAGRRDGMKDADGDYQMNKTFAETGLSDEDAVSATYEQGYQDGFASAYPLGYFFGYHVTARGEGIAIGYELGKADALAGKERIPPHQDALNDVDFSDGGEDGEAMRLYGIAIGYRQGYREHESVATPELVEIFLTDPNMGGVLGQINVRMGESCIPFPDAVPELVNDRTMVPVRAVMEHLGAEVAFLEGELVQITFGETVLKLTVGEASVTVSEAGETRDVLLDAAPYIKGDRTYVPLRFISEALGYDVFWDETYQTVVILDRAALIEEFGAAYTIADEYLIPARNLLLSGTQTDRSFTVTLKDAKGKTWKASGADTVYQGGVTQSVTGSVDLTPLAASGLPEALTKAGYGDRWAELTDYLTKQSYALHTSDSSFYIQSDLFEFFAWALLSIAPAQESDAWYVHERARSSAVGPVESIGALIYDSAVAEYAETNAFVLHDEMFVSSILTYDWTVGNDCFTPTADGYVLSLDAEALPYAAYENTNLGYFLRSILRDFKVDLTLGKDGSVSYAGSASLNVYNLPSALELSFTGTVTDKENSGSITIKGYDMFELTIAHTGKVTPLPSLPEPNIPADATIVDIS